MLEKTEIIKRVPFNAESRAHRQVVYDFIKTGKWGIHFEIPQGCKNLPYTLMEDVLLQFDKWEAIYPIQAPKPV